MPDPTDVLSGQSDDQLLLQFGEGDLRAAGALSQRLAPRLLAFAARMLGDRGEAEDVVQETMLRLWRIAPEWQPGRAKVSTWAFTAASNLCIDRLRRRRPETGMDAVETAPDGCPDAAAALVRADRTRALESALLTLPERQRQAVVLRHLEELSNPEIAEIMDIGVGAVESLTARGRRGLAAVLAPRKNDLGFDDEDI